MRGRISDYLLHAAKRAHGRGWYGLSVRLLDFDLFLAALPRTASRTPPTARAVQPAGGSPPIASRRRPMRVTERSWPYPSDTPFPLLPLAGALALAGSVALVALVIAGAIPG